jgi:probable rRNA maturation factor
MPDAASSARGGRVRASVGGSGARPTIGRSPARKGLAVSVVDERGRSVPAPGLAAWLRRVAPATARGAVSVALVSDRRVRTLNRTYRHKDYATDVLSFPAFAHSRGSQASARQAHPQSPVPSPRFLGDIVIARGVARRQAREARHSEQTELRVLALHGLLHLLGYDHEQDQGTMRRVERRLRRKGGLPAGLIERARTTRRASGEPVEPRAHHERVASGARVEPRAGA